MTVTVISGSQAQVFDQTDVTFSVEDGFLSVRDGDGNEVALFNEWDSVSTDAFDVAVTADAPVPQAPETAPVNPAPPEPTPHAEPAPAPVSTPETPEVPADTTVVPLTDTGASNTGPSTNPSTPGNEAGASTSDTSASDVVIPASPGGTTIGSPAS